jgi:hypothetical protein
VQRFKPQQRRRRNRINPKRFKPLSFIPIAMQSTVAFIPHWQTPFMIPSPSHSSGTGKQIMKHTAFPSATDARHGYQAFMMRPFLRVWRWIVSLLNATGGAEFRHYVTHQ